MLISSGRNSEENSQMGYAESTTEADTLHGSQDQLISPSTTPLAGALSNIPVSIARLPLAEQRLIHSLRQLDLRHWNYGDKSIFPMNKSEQAIVDAAFEMSATNQMTDFERLVLAKVRFWQSSLIAPVSLATYDQRVFINKIRDWRKTQKPEPFLKRFFRK